MALTPYPKLKTALFPQYTAPSVLPPDITLYHLMQVQYLFQWLVFRDISQGSARKTETTLGLSNGEQFNIENYLYRVIESRNQTWDVGTIPKLTKNKAINTCGAARTLKESGVMRTQKLEPSLGAKLKARLPDRSWEHWGWGCKLGGDAPENKVLEKYVGFSPLPTSHVVVCGG